MFYYVKITVELCSKTITELSTEIKLTVANLALKIWGGGGGLAGGQLSVIVTNGQR